MSDQFEADVRARKEHELEVLLSKHRDYGPKNIADSPGGALNGLRVRLHDKLARVNNLIDSGADPQHEGLIDTALDIANYGTIMALVLAGEWPGVEGGEQRFEGEPQDRDSLEIGDRVRILVKPYTDTSAEGQIIAPATVRGWDWLVEVTANDGGYHFCSHELERVE